MKFLDLAILRVLGTLLVVFSHAFYMFTYGDYSLVESVSVDYIRCFIKEIIVRFNMPLFVAISGFIFAYQLKYKEDVKSKTFIAKKFKRLIIPYVVFAPITLLSIGSFFDFKLIDIVKPIGHLWFILMLFSIFLIVYPGRKIYNSYLLLALSFFALFVVSIIPVEPFGLNEMGGGNYLAVNDLKKYFMYFFVGAGLFNFQIVRFKIKNLLILSLILLSLIILLHFQAQSFFAAGRFTLYTICTSVQGITYVILLFLLSNVIVRNKGVQSVSASKVFMEFDKYSFGIYLFHVVILNSVWLWKPFHKLALSYPFLIGLCLFVGALILSFYLTKLTYHYKIGRKFIGA